MNPNVIKSFLVGMGFSVDEEGFRKMTGAIDRLTKNFAILATGIIATVAALGVAVKKIAAEFETLFYLAERSGSTAKDVQALQYAFEQIGLSAGDAAGAVQGFAMALRNNPGVGGLLHQLGVETIDKTTGKMRDMTDIFLDFVGKKKNANPVVANAYAGMFGISPQLLLQMEQNLGQLLAAQQKAKQMQADSGNVTNQFAEKSRDFMNELRTLGFQVTLIWETVALRLMQVALPLMGQAEKFLHDHATEIVAIAGSISGVLLDVGGYAIDLVSDIDALVKATVGWNKALEIAADIILVGLLGPVGLLLIAWEKLKGGVTLPPTGTPGQGKPDDRSWWQRFFLPGPGLFDGTQKTVPPVTPQAAPSGSASPASRIGYQPDRDDTRSFITTVIVPILASLGLIRPESGAYPGGAAPGATLDSGPRVMNAAFRTLGEPSFIPPGSARQSGQLSPEIEAEVRRQAAAQGIDPERAVALFRAEGGGYHNVSGAGAVGPAQLMPGTAREMGVDINDWRDNVRGGIGYLAKLLRQFHGNWEAAEAGYNAGPGNAGVGELARTGNRGFLPGETQRYLQTIERNLRNATGGRAGGAASANINQTNHFNVTGPNPERTAALVDRKIRSTNSDLVRWGTGAVLA